MHTLSTTESGDRTTDERSSLPKDIFHPEVDTSHIDEGRLLRRIDLHVVPWVAFLYLFNFLDRGSIGNAGVSVTPAMVVRTKIMKVVLLQRGYRDRRYTISRRFDSLLLSILSVRSEDIPSPP